MTHCIIQISTLKIINVNNFVIYCLTSKTTVKRKRKFEMRLIYNFNFVEFILFFSIKKKKVNINNVERIFANKSIYLPRVYIVVVGVRIQFIAFLL